MSQENAKNFFKTMTTDNELKTEISARMKQGTLEQLVGLASENGFDFTVEEMMSAFGQGGDGELTDGALEGVSGAGPLDFVHDLNWQGIVDWWTSQGR